MNALSVEEEFRAALAREQREARIAGRAFARACATGDVDLFEAATGCLHETVGGWTVAMRAVARLPSVPDAIRSAFENVWIETKMLPLLVGDDRRWHVLCGS